MSRVQIHPLPGESGFINGNYGIDQTFVRGILRLEPTSSSIPLYLEKVSVTLQCRTNAAYYRPFEGEDVLKERY